MDNETLQHRLQRLDLGMVWLDNDNHVVAFNDVAWQLLAPAGEQTLGVSRDELIGIDLLQLHPQKSRDKLALLLHRDDNPAGIDQCPVRSPPAMTMMINIPDRVLLLKVSKMHGTAGIVGACMVYYDLTDITTSPGLDAHAGPVGTPNGGGTLEGQAGVPRDAARANGAVDEDGPPPGTAARRRPRQLRKIPVYRANRLILVDVEDTIRLESNDHYTWIVTSTDRYLSNLSLSDLEQRLDPAMFFRCHRSHIVNLKRVSEIERDGENLHLVFAKPEMERVPVSRAHARELREIVGL